VSSRCCPRHRSVTAACRPPGKLATSPPALASARACSPPPAAPSAAAAAPAVDAPPAAASAAGGDRPSSAASASADTPVRRQNASSLSSQRRTASAHAAWYATSASAERYSARNASTKGAGVPLPSPSPDSGAAPSAAPPATPPKKRHDAPSCPRAAGHCVPEDDGSHTSSMLSHKKRTRTCGAAHLCGSHTAD
jgi:hypothetical protein